MEAVSLFTFLSLLLILGKALRSAVPMLQWLYLPSSVIGGLLGLGVLSLWPSLLLAEYLTTLRSLPSFLINIVFAALFLGTVTPGLKKVIQLALPQLCFGQLMGWGQYVFGLGLCAAVLIPLFGVSAGFGNLLEIGFEGGHGTVGGMTESFQYFGWEDGISLGYAMATIGMVAGIVLGIGLINWGVRRGILQQTRLLKEAPKEEQIGVYADPQTAPNAGKQTVRSGSIDSLAWHIAIIGLAVLIGWGMLALFAEGEKLCRPSAATLFFSGFPLFPLCMIGGLILQKIMGAVHLTPLIDRGQMQRLSGASLDYLVVSAICTIRLDVLGSNWLPLCLLVLVGIIWALFLMLWLAPRLFKQDWFERGIAEFGQAMGVTATGLMLLRTVDPEARTSAHQAFGYKQLLHEPILGGGLWTALAFTLVFTWGILPVLAICTAVFLFWAALAYYLCRR